MIHLIFILLAAIFKAVADTLADHFSTSIFAKFPPKFWDKTQSWKYVPFIKFTKYRPDGWHLANTFMIFCFISACYFHGFFSAAWYWNFITDSAIFIVTFDAFYDKLLKK